MSKKRFSAALLILFTVSLNPQVRAEGFREGAASLFLPTTGQAMNGQLGAGKTKMMGTVEVASITAVTVLGIATGGATVLWGAIPLAANHVWSAADAYKNARNNNNANIMIAPTSGQEVYDAQRTLEESRQGRFDREQNARYDIRERVRLAGEQANS